MAARALIVDGVIIPAELWDATLEEQQAYAAHVKATNAAVIDAANRIEYEARRLGLDANELEGRGA